MRRLWSYWAPVLLVRAYRTVPPRIRGRYPFFGRGPSSSHLALEYLNQGWGWGAVKAALWVNGDSTRPVP